MRTRVKIVLMALIFLVPVTDNKASKSQARFNADEIVYICTGPKAATYHSSPNCRGLNRCSGDVAKVTLSKAKGMGRRPCKICY